MTRSRILVSLAAVLAVAVAAVVVGVAGPAPTGAAAAPDAPHALVRPRLSMRAEIGKAAYDGVCAACHGADAAGTDQGPPFVHPIYNPGHHADEAFFRAARDGVRAHHWRFGDMPAQPDVSERTVAAIIVYIREMQRANGIVTQDHRM